ncbi:MAG: alkylation repair protein [Sediminibacterium sp.]|nr:alkylation repair protein [Sediminibacterium sp.]
MKVPVLTAKHFFEKLSTFQTKPAFEEVQRFFRDEGFASKFLGIRMSNLFAVAKQFTQMPISEINKLLDSEFYEVRMGAVCIMDFQARDKKITVEQKKELFNLYIAKHDKIDTWDMVDRSAPYVVGGYLFDKPRTILYKLAKSANVCERRTAIVSTYFFIRQNDVTDTFKIAKLLVKDKHEMIHKAVGSWIREAGKRDKQQLLDFLDLHAVSMPRTMLRYAIEKLDKHEKDIYMAAKKEKL